MNATDTLSTPLSREFYARGTLVVARELLGKLLVRRVDGQMMAGRIVETEAYVGQDDLACHASRGRTRRTEILFGEAGKAYVYLIYGMHNCLNIVTERLEFPAAVLIRAVEPVVGVQMMRANREGRTLKETTNGPGKLCQAFGIDRRLNGVDICDSEELWVTGEENLSEQLIEASPRIGVDYAGACAAWPWRFTIAESEFLSR